MAYNPQCLLVPLRICGSVDVDPAITDINSLWGALPLLVCFVVVCVLLVLWGCSSSFCYCITWVDLLSVKRFESFRVTDLPAIIIVNVVVVLCSVLCCVVVGVVLIDLDIPDAFDLVCCSPS